MKATSPQTGQQQSGGTLKSMKDKSGQSEKDPQEGPVLKTAGPEGEITAGLCRYSTLNNCPPSVPLGFARILRLL